MRLFQSLGMGFAGVFKLNGVYLTGYHSFNVAPVVLTFCKFIDKIDQGLLLGLPFGSLSSLDLMLLLCHLPLERSQLLTDILLYRIRIVLLGGLEQLRRIDAELLSELDVRPYRVSQKCAFGGQETFDNLFRWRALKSMLMT